MAMEQLGRASTTQDFADVEGLVAFDFQYGESDYSIALSDDELDKILLSGFNRILDNRTVMSLDYMINLENGDLPLFVGVRSIDMTTSSTHFGQVNMGVAVVTNSVISELEQSGTLDTKRHASLGTWEPVGYTVEPPLAEHPATRA